MSKLRELIQQYATDGVRLVQLGDVAEVSVGSTPKSSSGKYSYINAGTFPSGTTDEYNTEADTITTPSRGQGGIGFVGYQTEKFWCGPLCYRIRSNKPEITTKYLFYVMTNDISTIISLAHMTGVPALNRKELVNFPIPLPPLPIQHEIVRILDNFAALTAELTAELTERKKQYEYYRHFLLTFEEPVVTALKDRQQIRRVALGEIATMLRGDYITQKNTKPGNVPVILGGQEPAYYCDRSNHEGKAIVISRSGAYAGFISFWDEPIFVTDGFILETSENIRYLFHYLKNMQDQLHTMKRGGGVPHVRGNEIMTITIALPSLPEQARIVAILDRFDTLCNDLTHGLPAEIAARKRQYEYYRDKLLNFEKDAS